MYEALQTVIDVWTCILLIKCIPQQSYHKQWLVGYARGHMTSINLLQVSSKFEATEIPASQSSLRMMNEQCHLSPCWATANLIRWPHYSYKDPSTITVLAEQVWLAVAMCKPNHYLIVIVNAW